MILLYHLTGESTIFSMCSEYTEICILSKKNMRKFVESLRTGYIKSPERVAITKD